MGLRLFSKLYETSIVEDKNIMYIFNDIIKPVVCIDFLLILILNLSHFVVELHVGIASNMTM